MNSLYDKIAATEKLTARNPHQAPVVDQSTQASFGMDWAARQAQRPAPPEIAVLKPIVAVAN